MIAPRKTDPPSRNRRARRLELASALIALAALWEMGCARAPADGAARRAEARAALEAAVGPFPTSAAGGAAGLRLREAVGAVAIAEHDRPLFRRLANGATSEWSAADRLALAAALEARAATIALLRSAAIARPDGLGLAVPLPDNAFPDLRPLLDASRVLVLDARQALAAGESARASEDARALGGLLRATGREPWLITQLLANAGERNAGGLVADALAARDAAVNSELQSAFRGLDEIAPQAWIAGEASLAEHGFARRQGERDMKEIRGFDAAYGDVVVAKLYDRYRRLAALIEGGWSALGPWTEAQEREAEARREMNPGLWLRLAVSPARRVEHVSDTVADLLWMNLLDAVKKGMATRSLRALSALALEVAEEGRLGGTLPAGAPADFRNDYTGEQPVFETRADGAIHLALPLTAAAWRRDFPTDVVQPRLEWDVPPPAQSANRSPGTAAKSPPRS